MAQYWVIVTTPRNFAIDRQLGFSKQGFNSRSRNHVNQVKLGDKMIVYVAGAKRFGAVVEVTSELYFDDTTPIWSQEDEIWPWRFDTKPLIALEEDQMLDARKVVQALTFVTEKQKSVPKGWGLAFHYSLRPISQEDGERIESEMRKLSALALTFVGPGPEPPVTTLPPLKPPPKAPTGRIFGGVLNFRGLQHEPVNEDGVILLFGMVANELGFLVEAVGAGFPDCRAKRRIKGGYYTEVDIEFEFRSSNFRAHGHDPTKCGLVVCWENDWSDCPIEVLELKTAIKQLNANV